jgi:hypothetical protein
VSGPGSSASFLTRKGQATQILRTLTTRTEGAVTDRIALDFRASSARRIEPARSALKRFSGPRQAAWGEGKIGDVLASLTPFALNRGLKGFHLAAKDWNGWDMQVVGGIAKNEWNQLWQNDPAEAKDVYVSGAGVRREMGPLTLGLHHAFTDENRSKRNATALIANNHVTSADLRLDGGGLVLESEAARSALKRENVNLQSGWAQTHRLSISGGKVRLRTDYDRVDGKFSTLSGAATPDREFASGEFDVRGPAGIAVDARHDYVRNNLAHNPVVSTSYENDSRLTVTRRGVTQRTVRLTAGLRTQRTPGADRDRRSWGGGVSDKWGPVRWDGSYENSLDDDKTSVNTDVRQDVLSGQASARFQSGTMFFLPRVNTQVRRERHLADGTGSRTVGAGGGLSFESGRAFSLSVGVDHVKTERPLVKDGQTVKGSFASARWEVVRGAELSAEWRSDDNTFGTGVNDYREETLRGELTYKF